MKAKDTDATLTCGRAHASRASGLRIYGPAEFPRLLFDNANWGDQIGSLRVGRTRSCWRTATRTFRTG